MGAVKFKQGTGALIDSGQFQYRNELISRTDSSSSSDSITQVANATDGMASMYYCRTLMPGTRYKYIITITALATVLALLVKRDIG